MMKSFISTLICTLFFSTSILSQNFKPITIYKTDKTIINANGKFNYNHSDFIVSVSIKDSGDQSKTIVVNLNEIVKIESRSVVFVVKDYNLNNYLFKQIIEGSLSLFENKNNFYLENESFKLKNIPYKIKDNLKLTVFDYGVLNLFVEKCKSAQDETYNNATNLTLQKLKYIINKYNSCDLSTEAQIPTKAIAKANEPKEIVNFAFSVGSFLAQAEFNDLSENSSTNLLLPSIGVKVYFNTNLLDKRLVFHISGDYFSGSEKRIDSDTNNLLSKTSFISFMIGSNYNFNKTNSIFKPYVGVNGGIYFNSFASYVELKSNIYGIPGLFFNTKNNLAFNFHGGSQIKISNNYLDIQLIYQPKMNFDLYSGDINKISSFYKFSGVNLKVSYLF